LNIFKAIGIGIAALIVVFAVSFFMSFTGYAQYSFFAPRYTAVDSKVFHESQQYNDGMVRDLENLKREYQHADPAGKDALKATVLHRFEIYPRDRMTPDLQNFYDQLSN
jgi:hypothetical protein